MPLDPPAQAITTSMSGTVTFQHDLAFPFLKDVVEALGEAGIPELDDSHNFTEPPWWQGRTSQPPTAFLDPVSLGISLLLFSRTPVGEWAIDRVCDTLWEKAAKPALRQLIGKRNPGSSGGADTVRFRVGTWFEEDKLFIEVVADLKPRDDGRTLEQLVPEAFRLAAKRIEAQSIRPAVLTFRIQDGTLVRDPIESEQPIS